MPDAINQKSWIWTDSGTEPTQGDEKYVAGDQPIAEYDNWFNWAISSDIDDLNAKLGDHNAFHEAGGQDEIDLDGLSVGASLVLAETGTDEAQLQASDGTMLLEFDGSNQRIADSVDFHSKTTFLRGIDVNASNITGLSTLVQSSGNHVLEAKGSTSNYNVAVQDGHGRVHHYWNVEPGTQNIITEAEGASWFNQEGGTMDFRVYGGSTGDAGASPSWTHVLQLTTGSVDLQDVLLDVNGNDIEDSGTTIWNTSAGHLEQAVLENDSYGVSLGTHLSGSSSVSLGGTLTLSINDDFVLNTGDSMTGTLTMQSGTQITVGSASGGESTFQANSSYAGDGYIESGWIYANAIEAETERGGSTTAIELGSTGHLTSADEVALITQGNVNLKVDSSQNVQVTNDLQTDSGTVIWDATNSHVPQGRLENDSITINRDSYMTGGGSVSLGGSISIGVDESLFVETAGDSMSGHLEMGSNAVTFSTTNIGDWFVDTQGSDKWEVRQTGTNGAELQLTADGTDYTTANLQVGGSEVLLADGRNVMTGTLDMNDQTITNVEHLEFYADSVQRLTVDTSAGEFRVFDTNGNTNPFRITATDIQLSRDVNVGSKKIVGGAGSLDFSGSYIESKAPFRVGNRAHFGDDTELFMGASHKYGFVRESGKDRITFFETGSGSSYDSTARDIVYFNADGPVEFLNGIEAGSIEAPEDSYVTLVDQPVTDSATSGDLVGYAFAIDARTGYEIVAEADGSGGLAQLRHQFYDENESLVLELQNNAVWNFHGQNAINFGRIETNGRVDLKGDITDTQNSVTIYDQASQHVPASSVEDVWVDESGDTMTGDLTMGSNAVRGNQFDLGGDTNGALELGDSTTTTAKPFIDFSYGVGASQDYNVRIQNTADLTLSFDGAGGTPPTLQVQGTTLYDGSNQHVPQGRLENDAITINSGTHLTGGATVALGGSITLDVSDDWIQETGDTITGDLIFDVGARSQIRSDSSLTSNQANALYETFDTGAGTRTGYVGHMGNGEDNMILAHNGTNNELRVGGVGIEYNGNTVYHAGMDGDGSGINADLLDGHDSTDIVLRDGSQGFTASVSFNDNNANSVGILNVSNITSNNGSEPITISEPFEFQNDVEAFFGNSKDFAWHYDSGTDELVLDDGNVELIRQPKAGPTELIQGVSLGTLEAPTDSYTQLIDAPATSDLADGDQVGYTLAIDSRTAYAVYGLANGTGGIKEIQHQWKNQAGEELFKYNGSGYVRFSDGSGNKHFSIDSSGTEFAVTTDDLTVQGSSVLRADGSISLTSSLNVGGHQLTDVSSIKFEDDDGDGEYFRLGESNGRLRIKTPVSGSADALQVDPSNNLYVPNGDFKVQGSSVIRADGSVAMTGTLVVDKEIEYGHTTGTIRLLYDTAKNGNSFHIQRESSGDETAITIQGQNVGIAGQTTPSSALEVGGDVDVKGNTITGSAGSIEFAGAWADVTGNFYFSNVAKFGNDGFRVGGAGDFEIRYDTSESELVVEDGDGIELIRQPKAAPTKFIQGIEAGTMELPDDGGLVTAIDMASTSAASSGDTLGYGFSINAQTGYRIEADADGSGGIQTLQHYWFNAAGNEVFHTEENQNISFSGNLALNDNAITGVSRINISDPGSDEGIHWSNWRVYESPNDLSNGSGNFQVVHNGTRALTVDGSDNLEVANGDATVRGSVYADNHGFGGTPDIALAVGDTDTGLHSTTNGVLEIYQDNNSRATVDGSAFNVTTTLQQNGNDVATQTWVSSNYAATGHTHDSRYVNEGGDSMSGNLDLGSNHLSAAMVGLGNSEQGDYTGNGNVWYDQSAGVYVYYGSATNSPDGSEGAALMWNQKNVTAGTDISISYATEGQPTIDHADTSSQGNVSAGAGAAITAIDLDGRGHVTSIGTTDFDGRFVNAGGDTMSGALDMDNNNITGASKVVIADPGGGEGLHWNGANAEIVNSPLDGSNTSGYLRLINDQGIALEDTTSLRNGYSFRVGIDHSQTITETSSPASFTFNGTADRDIHLQTDVSLSNSSGAEVTEDVTVALYEGTDNTGTEIQSETRSLTIANGGSTTATFISTNKPLKSSQTYYIEVTTTDLTVDQTDEITRGAEYTVGQTDTGVLHIRNQFSEDALTIDPITSAIDFNENEAENFVLEKRTSDPASATVGQMWYRSDLD